MTKDYKNLRIYNAVSHEVALAAEEAPDTPELRRDVDALMAFTKGRLFELRRAELRRADQDRARVPVVVTVRPSILALTREVLIERLASLMTAQPRTVIAHRDFAAMTDDDLREALEDATASAERSGAR